MIEKAKNYIQEHGSGTILWIMLLTMLFFLIFKMWYALASLVSAGIYLELVHIRSIIQAYIKSKRQ